MKHILFSVLVLLIAVTGRAQTFTWNGQMPIFDFTTDTISIPVSGLPVSIDTNFGIAHICFDITHTYDNDLVIKLFSPAGDSVILIQGIGGAGDNFLGTCVGMDGTHFSNTTAPYSGIFVPIGNVAAFNNGQNPNGIWRCTVYDGAGADTGSVHMVSISFVNNPPRQGSAGTGPVGTYICPTCVCPGGASACDLLPDMTASAKEIQLNHTETPGALYIANATPNIGYGPLEIYGIDSCFCGTTHVPCGTICPGNEEIKQVIKQRIYQKVAGTDTLSYYDRFAGTMTFHPTHGHLHVDDFANFTLRSATSNPDATTWPIIGTGTKQSFCLINLGTCAGNYGECTNGTTVVTTVPNQGLGFHTGCGLTQGIYAGSYDVYSMSLNDPIPLTNVCNGTYYIVSITDPNDNFLESDETNNWVAVPITLTQQGNNASISASGPLQFCPGDSVILTSTFSPSYLWSTGETTQSIVVKTSGSYTVTVNCGTAVSVSSPVNVQVINPSTLPQISIALTAGNNPSCPGLSKTFTATILNGGNNPVYQWKVNGVNVGTNAATYTTSSLLGGQIVSCELLSSLSCITNPSAVSNSILIQNSSSTCYCTPLYGSTGNSGCLDGDVIARVILNTLDNNSGTGCPSGIAGYSDYSASTNPLHTTSLHAGSSYTMTVYTGQYGEGYKAWIDFNDDGVFSSSETIGYTLGIIPGSGSVGVLGSMGTFTALIPCSGTTGNHRLRVRCSYNNNGVNIDPCNLMNSYGEAEDYTITILAPTGCTPPNTLSVSNLAAKNATLNWNAGCTETSWNVHLTTAGGGAPTGTSSHPSVTSNPLLVAGLTPGTAYEFWVQAICSGGNSIWTGPFAFTTLPVCSTIPGTSFSNPIDLGQAHCISLASSNTQTNVSANCFSNNYTGTANQNSPDIWYRFTLSQNATVQISHCNSSFDTYLHLLNSTGTQIQGNDDNGPLCTGLRASISATLNAGTYYIVSEGYGNNTGAITTLLNTTEICPAAMSFATKNFLQGYWNGMNGMVPVLNNQGISAGVQDCDSLNIQIHQAQSPYPIVASATSILQQDGTTQWQLPVLYGNYYIHIRHRNAVDTWSATPIPFSHYASSYDFSTAANKAFGNNQVNLAPGIWGFYTGDLNEDDNIDILDGTVLENDIFIFGSGYLATDLNGDGNTDLLDDPLLQSNISNFIFSSHP